MKRKILDKMLKWKEDRAGDEVKDLFCNSLNDLDSFFMYLSAIFGVTLYEQESLIILDRYAKGKYLFNR